MEEESHLGYPSQVALPIILNHFIKSFTYSLLSKCNIKIKLSSFHVLSSLIVSYKQPFKTGHWKYNKVIKYILPVVFLKFIKYFFIVGIEDKLILKVLRRLKHPIADAGRVCIDI